MNTEDLRLLKEILPICMFCKKIRDDEGDWSQLEQYVHEHTDSEFSHGICPDCMREQYGDEMANRYLGSKNVETV